MAVLKKTAHVWGEINGVKTWRINNQSVTIGPQPPSPITPPPGFSSNSVYPSFLSIQKFLQTSFLSYFGKTHTVLECLFLIILLGDKMHQLNLTVNYFIMNVFSITWPYLENLMPTPTILFYISCNDTLVPTHSTRFRCCTIFYSIPADPTRYQKHLLFFEAWWTCKTLRLRPLIMVQSVR